MALSFMALPVIPKLKITDKGLFDAEGFKPVKLAFDQ
jgi:adenine deaminase